jgi:putative transposase
MMILDAVHYNVRDNGIVTQKAVYVAIGTDLDGKKDVLDIWLGASEPSKYWLSVLNGLKSRGVQDILKASVNGLSGFVEAINVAFPKTEVQRYIIHQIRSSTRYVPYKDVKQYTTDLKPDYRLRPRRQPFQHWMNLKPNGVGNTLWR